MADGAVDKADLKASKHVADFDIKIGKIHATSRLSITTNGLLAVATLVGVILSGTAGIVWTATGPARRRAEQGTSASAKR
jgi:hypothetical protein